MTPLLEAGRAGARCGPAALLEMTCFCMSSLPAKVAHPVSRSAHLPHSSAVLQPLCAHGSVCKALKPYQVGCALPEICSIVADQHPWSPPAHPNH